MIIRGGGSGGWGGVLTFLTSTSFTLRKMRTLHMLSYDHQGGKSFSRLTKSLLRLIIFEVVCGVNPIEPLLLVLNTWMEHGNT